MSEATKDYLMTEHVEANKDTGHIRFTKCNIPKVVIEKSAYEKLTKANKIMREALECTCSRSSASMVTKYGLPPLCNPCKAKTQVDKLMGDDNPICTDKDCPLIPKHTTNVCRDAIENMGFKK